MGTEFYVVNVERRVVLDVHKWYALEGFGIEDRYTPALMAAEKAGSRVPDGIEKVAALWIWDLADGDAFVLSEHSDDLWWLRVDHEIAPGPFGDPNLRPGYVVDRSDWRTWVALTNSGKPAEEHVGLYPKPEDWMRIARRLLDDGHTELADEMATCALLRWDHFGPGFSALWELVAPIVLAEKDETDG